MVTDVRSFNKDKLIKFLYLECGPQAEIKPAMFKNKKEYIVLEHAFGIPKTVGELIEAISHKPRGEAYIISEDSPDRLVFRKSLVKSRSENFRNLRSKSVDMFYWCIDKTKNHSGVSDG